jgi:predicted DNA-binding protein (MmcQ/YjbR family)
MHPTSTPSTHTQKQVAALRARALGYPETREDFPWGHSAFKVKGKAFAFLHADAQGFSISVKLPDSNSLALQFPFAQPTGYGLGKSGWVSAQFADREQAPLHLLCDWLEESFRAIAPKRLAARLSGTGNLGRGVLQNAAAPARDRADRASGRAKPGARAKAPARARPKARAAAKGPKVGQSAAKPATAKRPAAKNKAAKKASRGR